MSDKCKYCGALTIFIKTQRGSLIECDAGLTEVWRTSKGDKVAVTAQGELIICFYEPDLFSEPELAHIPHRWSCSFSQKKRERV